jgi:hypothetical protein
MLPRLLVIGAQKAGTQSLTHYLSLHPQTWMCRRELDFFSDDATWARGVEWYAGEIAAPDDPRLVVGETSPSYAMARAFPHTVERVAATLPDVRLVYLLRDPIERMRSAYQHGLASGVESRPMREALLDDPFYLDASSYAAQIERYLDRLPAEQLLLVLSDDLRSRRRETVDRVLDFVGLPARPDLPLTDEIHATEHKRVPRAWARALGSVVISRGLEERVPGWLADMRERQSPLMTRPFRPDEAAMSPELRAELANRLTPDVRRLRAWLGPDFDGWGLLA